MFKWVLIGVVGSCFSVCCGDVRAEGYAVQVGAFSSLEHAEVHSAEIRLQGIEPVSVFAEESAKFGMQYKVLVSGFASRADASKQKETLAGQGIDGFVRQAQSYDIAAVRAVINGATESNIFATSHPLTVVVDEALTASMAAQRSELLASDTTSPQTLERYFEFLDALPDSSTAKGAEIITYASYTFSGKSAYDGVMYDFSAANDLLQKVASGSVAASPAHRLRAKAMLAHSLHYYSQNYLDTLPAYREILALHLENQSWVQAAKIRMEIAGASYELAERSGFDWGELQPVILSIWDEAVAMQEPFLEGAGEGNRQIRNYTSRIGLMLSETYIEQEKWEETKEIAQNLIAMYREYPECKGILAEAYCHLGKVGIKLRDKQLCYEAVDHAIELSNQAGRVWGDVNRDPLWKAYALKNAAAYYFDEPDEVRRRIKDDMYRLFPNHPGLETYFGGGNL